MEEVEELDARERVIEKNKIVSVFNLIVVVSSD